MSLLPTLESRAKPPLQVAEQLVADVQLSHGIEFAGQSQRVLTVIFCRAMTGEWVDPIPCVGDPDLRPHHLIDNLARNGDLIPEEFTWYGDPLSVCAVVRRLPPATVARRRSPDTTPGPPAPVRRCSSAKPARPQKLVSRSVSGSRPT